MARFTAAERHHLAKTGAALPDGSFPIIGPVSLDAAIRLVGNATDPAAAKRHVVKRARQLQLKGHLPISWQ